MREIKFRAWRKTVEEIMLWEDLKNWEIPLGEDEDHILMQFTGLLDKNGVEIYEGDIVKFGKVRFVGKVTYTPVANEDCKSKIYFSAGAFYTEEGLLSDMLAWHDIEVIGNIYENKDLLK